MSTFKDMNIIVVVAMLQLANKDEGDGDGHRVLDIMLQLGLYVHLMRES